jgi:hypothetical protein
MIYLNFNRIVFNILLFHSKPIIWEKSILFPVLHKIYNILTRFLNFRSKFAWMFFYCDAQEFWVEGWHNVLLFCCDAQDPWVELACTLFDCAGQYFCKENLCLESILKSPRVIRNVVGF